MTAAAVILGEPLRPELLLFAGLVACSVAAGSAGRSREVLAPQSARVLRKETSS